MTPAPHPKPACRIEALPWVAARSRDWPKAIVGALSIALSIALLSGCGKSAAEPAAPAMPQVRTAQAKAGAAAAELRLPARVEAGQHARLYARATGVVQSRGVDIGDRVRAGQVLARISAPEIDNAVREARAALAEAQAAEGLASGNLRRAEPLAAQKLISQEQLSERRGTYEAALASRKAAEARLASSADIQGFQAVRAPFDGVISARNIERGDQVIGDAQGAATPLFEISALDPLRVVVDVPQSVVLGVRTGLQARVAFPEVAGEPAVARVARVAHSISRESNGMRVELSLPNPDERIPAGMIGEVTLQVPRTAPVAVVPISAVMQRGRDTQVAMLAAGNRVAFRPVTLGRNLGNEVEIIRGIQPDETVVLSPNALLQDGVQVALAQQADANAKGAASAR